MGYKEGYRPQFPRKVNSGAMMGLERKERGIKVLVDRKEKSMAEFAIRRDAGMFASCPKSKEELKADYQYWTEFFTNIYLPPEKTTEEMLEEAAPKQETITVERVEKVEKGSGNLLA